MIDLRQLSSQLSSRINSLSNSYSVSLSLRGNIEVTPVDGRDILSTPVLFTIARFCKEFELCYIVRVCDSMPVVVIYSFSYYDYSKFH